MFKFLAGMIAMAAIAAFASVPSEQAAEELLRNQLITALTTEEIDGKDGATAIALMGCRLQPDTCYELVRSGIETRYDHRMVYATFSLEGFGRQASCIGMFTRFVCPGGITKQ